jgi:hypothetical protein
LLVLAVAGLISACSSISSPATTTATVRLTATIRSDCEQLIQTKLPKLPQGPEEFTAIWLPPAAVTALRQSGDRYLARVAVELRTDEKTLYSTAVVETIRRAQAYCRSVVK